MSKKGLLNAVKELAALGVGRNSRNTMQNYMFRSADDVMDTVTPILAKNNVIMRPVFEVVRHEVKERPTQKGMSYVTSCYVKLTLSFYDALDDSENSCIEEVVAYAEANDTGDKCIMKAQTSAYKYALIFGLGIPVTGTADPDFTGEPVEEPAPQEPPKLTVKPVVEQAPPVQAPPQEPAKPKEKPTIKVEKSIEELSNINLEQGQKEMLERLGIKL